jgi:serine carboxypeptidase-like clade 2
MGPWHPAYGGTLNRNDYSWTRSASMVFIEQPAGVGFSFSTDRSILRDFNDHRAAEDNVKIIRAFYKKFPDALDLDLYLASESYGGHYIPQWTYEILNVESNSDLRRRLKGYLVGNPFTSFASGSIAMTNILWGLQLIPKNAW